MSRVEILQKMQLVIQEQMGKEDIVLTEDTKLDDLGVDSIELMEFIINLEDEFSLEISDNTIDHMDKVSDFFRNYRKSCSRGGRAPPRRVFVRLCFPRSDRSGGG